MTDRRTIQLRKCERRREERSARSLVRAGEPRQSARAAARPRRTRTTASSFFSMPTRFVSATPCARSSSRSRRARRRRLRPRARSATCARFIARCQALEYICGFNLDRRAYTRWNCITSCPARSARSAKRDRRGGRTQSRDAGGRHRPDPDPSQTRQRIVYVPDAIAWTEAPETVRTLARQRFRWAFGTLQCLWKHRDMVFNWSYRALGWFSLPSIWFFQIILVAHHADGGFVPARLASLRRLARGPAVRYHLPGDGRAPRDARLHHGRRTDLRGLADSADAPDLSADAQLCDLESDPPRDQRRVVVGGNSSARPACRRGHEEITNRRSTGRMQRLARSSPSHWPLAFASVSFALRETPTPTRRRRLLPPGPAPIPAPTWISATQEDDVTLEAIEEFENAWWANIRRSSPRRAIGVSRLFPTRICSSSGGTARSRSSSGRPGTGPTTRKRAGHFADADHRREHGMPTSIAGPMARATSDSR